MKKLEITTNNGISVGTDYDYIDVVKQTNKKCTN